ncbi:MAG TPA: bifunctional phosphopantothenoylcysteine decarboxylase/phosphopantothenate--cysteine ligase CoaBC [Anaerolineales bacterium]|nr:bifunctional phosphopantothenoylcysteine decarboxylase/phosphopantothenate--cysteine ligase CoaBC [Anaerolineales bacterium]
MMKTPLADKNILLGVTGSIAAYKAADLASKLSQAGAVVDVILTEAALEFITRLTFQSVTGRRAYVDADLWGPEGHIQHIRLAKEADLLVIAPATANSIAKLANGVADNLLSLTALAADCPLLIVPAMDGGMFSHPATQTNLNTLRQRGALIIGPAEGHLASGLAGPGRMVEPAELLGQIRWKLAQGGPLTGRKVIVTAGGTQEPIDPVRFIANRSSGKQGFALAQAALDLGAEVTLVAAPTPLPTPFGAKRVVVETAEEMRAAVIAEIGQAAALLMAAAVADFRPAGPAKEKIKRKSGVPEVKLETTPDILAEVAELRSKGEFSGVVVGFAAESQELLENAQDKMHSRRLDLIVANDITAKDAGFAVDTNQVILLDAAGNHQELPLMSKAEVAGRILEQVLRLLK